MPVRDILELKESEVDDKTDISVSSQNQSAEESELVKIVASNTQHTTTTNSVCSDSEEFQQTVTVSSRLPAESETTKKEGLRKGKWTVR